MTKAASSVTETGATLNATVNPEGTTVTKCEFEYGTSTSYGKTAPCASAPGSGSSSVGVSAAITGLSANTTYDFRIVATNGGGESKGLNETFKTTAPAAGPPAVMIGQLLQEVSSSHIPHSIRHELSGLLSDALRGLEELSDYGQLASAPRGVVLRSLPTRGLMLSPKAKKADRHRHQDRHRHESSHQRACNALEEFIDVIEDDQRGRKPQIPANLASAWSQAAHSIETSLGCGSDQHPGDSDD